MLLDADDPSRVIGAHRASRSWCPRPTTSAAGTVPNVVFPTAIEEVDGVRYVFYGMADSKIGVARLDHVRTTSMTRTLRNTVGAVVLGLLASLLGGRADELAARRPP